MLNYIWLFLIIISLVCGLFTGNIHELSQSILSAGTDAVSLCMKLMGAMCLWCGLMNIAEKSGLCSLIARFMAPLLKLLMPSLRYDSESLESVSMNITANLLGLGNAATPLGIKAIENMKRQSNEKDTITRDMAVFTVMNTAAVRLIPSTAAALRESAGSHAPMEIITCVWISSALSLICAVTAVILTRRFVKQ